MSGAPARFLRLLLAATILLPPVGLAGDAVLSSRQAAAEARARLLREAGQEADTASRTLRAGRLLLDDLATLAAAPAAGAGTAARTRLAVLRQRLPDVAGFVLTDGAGRSLAADGAAVPVPPEALSAPPGHLILASVSGRVGSTPQEARAGADLILAERLGGADGGVAALRLHATPLARQDDALATGLLRQDGTVLSAPAASGRVPADLIGFAAAVARAPASGLFETGPGAAGHLVAYSALPGLPAYAWAALPDTAITAGWLRLLLWHTATWAPLALALALVTALALRRTRQVAQALAEAAEEMRRRLTAEGAAREAQRLETVERLAVGVAQDFANLLSVVTGSAELAKARWPQDSSRLLDAILRAAQRGEGLTRQLVTLAGPRTLHPQLLDLAAEMPRLLGAVKEALGRDARLHLEIAEEPWPVHADRAALEHALMSMAINARAAMPPGGIMRLRLARRRLRPGDIAAAPQLAGEFMALAVSDTGAGMPPEGAARGFESFAMLPPDGAAGTGLSQVEDFARASGGVAVIESAAGGTTVTLLLPRGEGVPVTPPPARPDAVRGITGRRIVLVDDNADVSDVTAAVLRGLGCEVEVFDRAEAAVRRLEHGSEPDLLLSDIVMPEGIDGLELARRARAAHPHLPVLLMSGHSDAVPEFGSDFVVLPKPVRMAALEETIRRILGAAPQPGGPAV